MNKKEKALMEEYATVAALRWSDPVEPDVMPPESLAGGVVTGFMPIAQSSDRPRVEHACSSAHSHGVSYEPISKPNSPRSRALYSTRLMALRQLRHAVAQECARRLWAIDRQIESEEAQA